MLRHALSLLTLFVIGYWGSSVTAEQSMPLLGDWAARLEVSAKPTVLWLTVTETPAREVVASVRIDSGAYPTFWMAGAWIHSPWLSAIDRMEAFLNKFLGETPARDSRN